MSLLRRIALLLAMLTAANANSVVTTSVVDVPTPSDGTQRFLYLRPDAPVANIVDLPGGDGILGIQNDGTMTTHTAFCNPVARNRQAFADHGYALALVDQTSTGSVYDFNDVLQVVLYMQAHDNVPTWIIGGSSSTVPVANLGVNLPLAMPVGLIFFSPTTPWNPSQLASIKRPTLVVYHPFDIETSATAFFAALTSAPVKEIVSLTGGNNNGCGYHLFNGIDADFIAATTGFIDKYNGTLGGGTPSTAVAVEYYYDVWNFYFETSFPDEIAALDGGAFGGAWKRTGQTFKVWPQSNPSASPTCRFFSTAFAPKSSHFYTPFPIECAVVKTDPGWAYEAIAFYVQLTDVNGMCGAGTVPLYRVYNNGIGDAPNHRYTTSRAIRDQMLTLGWLAEGNGPDIIFACVPM